VELRVTVAVGEGESEVRREDCEALRVRHGRRQRRPAEVRRSGGEELRRKRRARREVLGGRRDAVGDEGAARVRAVRSEGVHLELEWRRLHGQDLRAPPECVPDGVNEDVDPLSVDGCARAALLSGSMCTYRDGDGAEVFL